ncbi:hypothetical protein HDU93_005839, partial [Gonapodya sp. JEL0774]
MEYGVDVSRFSPGNRNELQKLKVIYQKFYHDWTKGGRKTPTQWRWDHAAFQAALAEVSPRPNEAWQGQQVNLRVETPEHIERFHYRSAVLYKILGEPFMLAMVSMKQVDELYELLLARLESQGER